MELDNFDFKKYIGEVWIEEDFLDDEELEEILDEFDIEDKQ